MITLKTLPQATEQEVFDQAAHHLLTQKESCTGIDGSCMYRYKGLKCAGGCFIADDEYNPNMEGEGWFGLIGQNIAPDEHDNLINSLQSLHDSESTENWEQELETLAKAFSLKPYVLKSKSK